MAEEEIPDHESGLGEVQITVVVVPGRLRATLAKFLGVGRVRAGFVFGGLVLAAAVAAVIAVSLSSGRAGRPLGPDALARQFAPRLSCSRRTVTSPDGAYARVDFDHAGPCRTIGNQVTLVLHRSQGAWAREFEASRWTCPIRRLPQPVTIELQLCRSSGDAGSPGAALSKIALDH
jgi:hypothetical protein